MVSIKQLNLFYRYFIYIKLNRKVVSLFIVLVSIVCLTSLLWISRVVQKIANPSNDIPVGVYTYDASNIQQPRAILQNHKSTTYTTNIFDQLLKKRGVNTNSAVYKCSNCYEEIFYNNAMYFDAPISIYVNMYEVCEGIDCKDFVQINSTNTHSDFDLAMSYIEATATESILIRDEPGYQPFGNIHIFKYIYSGITTNTFQNVPLLNTASILIFYVFLLLAVVTLALYNCNIITKFKDTYFLNYLCRSGFHPSSYWIPLWLTSLLECLLIASVSIGMFQIDSSDMNTVPPHRNTIIFLCVFALCLYVASISYLLTVLLRRYVLVVLFSVVLLSIISVMNFVNFLAFVTDPTFEIFRTMLLIIPPISLSGVMVDAHYGNPQTNLNIAAIVAGYCLPFIFVLLTWYLDNILGNGNGLQLPFNYVFSSKFWKVHKAHISETGVSTMDYISRHDHGPNIERVSASLQSVIKINNISKQYQISNCFGRNKTVNAVQNFSINIYESQITCIIGHNGAGKTSLISILTGKESCDAGNARMGNILVTDRLERLKIDQEVGVCEQSDVVCDHLTVEQNIRLVLAARNQMVSERVRDITHIMIQIGLQDKRFSLAGSLSGGQKRKLCTLLALAGNPSIVFLDEPSSGLDPVSRRELWQVLQEYKTGRCVILSSHFMDEADLLADIKIFMTGGKLICAGSSLFLKHAFGCGSIVNISMTSPETTDSVFNDLLAICASAKKKRSEGSELEILVPIENTENLSSIMSYLEQSQHVVSSYGLSQTSLNEIFMQIGDMDVDVASIEQYFTNKSVISGLRQPKEENQLHFNMKNCVKQSFGKQFSAIFSMNLLRLRKQKLKLFCRFIFPVILLLLLIGGLYLNSKVDIADMLPSNITITPEPSFDNRLDFCVGDETDNSFGNSELELLCRLKFTKQANMSIYNFVIENSKNMFNYSSEFCGPESKSHGSIPCNLVYLSSWNIHTSNKNTTEAYIGTLQNGSPYASIFYVDVVLLLFSGFTPINLYNKIHKMAYFSYLNLFYLDFGLYTFNVLLAIIPVTYLSDPMEDKQSKVRNQMSAMGLSTLAYWTNTCLLHWIQYCLFYIIGSLALVIAASTSTIFANMTMGVFVLLPVGIIGLPSVLIFCYFLGSLFKKPQTSLTLFIFFIQLFLSMSIMGLLSTNGILSVALSWLWPPLAPLSLLFNSAKLRFNANRFHVEVQPNSIEYAKLLYSNPYCLNSLLAIVTHFMLFCILLSVSDNFQIIKSNIRQLFKQTRTKYSLINTEEIEYGVKKEIERSKANDVLVINNLKKTYSNNTAALKGVNFGVQSNEILALLGPNGAGKSTTLSIIVGDEQPTDGNNTIRHDGETLVSGNIAASKGAIGYCPQYNPLFEQITVEEHMNFYARFRGIKSKEIINQQTNNLINHLSLEKHRKKQAGQLSGGNKRRLCLAIALLGDPSMTVIDEASSGVDPETKLSIWSALRSLRREGHGVLITTHAMEEAEAVASRVGIMNHGKLIAFGTTQQLKSRYGQTYNLEFMLTNEEDDVLTDEIQERKKRKLISALVSQFPSVKVQESLALRLLVNVETKDISRLSTALAWVNENMTKYDIAYYSFYQSSLDQIFITLVRSTEIEEQSVESNALIVV